MRCTGVYIKKKIISLLCIVLPGQMSYLHLVVTRTGSYMLGIIHYIK